MRTLRKIMNFSKGVGLGLAPRTRVRRQMRGLLCDRAGTIALTTAFGIFTLLGVTGLSVTAGDWYFTHRAMQSAADAGALGGAVQLVSELSTGQNVSSSAVTTAAKNDTANNGFTDGQNGVTVTAAINNNQYVTVTVSQPARLMLAGLFMGTPPTISATAQAGIVYNGASPCVWATSPNAAQAIASTGGGAIQANCPVVNNSNSPTSYYINGNGTIDGSKICGPGGYAVSGGNGSFAPTPSKCVPIPDLYAANNPVPPQASQVCQYGNSGVGISSGTTVTGNTTLSPGVYCGGIFISSTANVTFQPGLYILRNGGITASGQALMAGSHVSFYLTGSNSQVNIPSDNIALSGQAQVNFTGAQASDLPSGAQFLAGFIFYQDVTAASTGTIMNTLSGNSNVKYDGTIYFGNQNVNVVGNGVADGTSPFTRLIANTITYSGNGTLVFNSNCSQSLSGCGSQTPPKMGQVALTN